MTSIVVIAEAPIPAPAANAVQTVQVANGFAAHGFDTTLLAPWTQGTTCLVDAYRDLGVPYAPSERFAFHRVPFVEVRGRLHGSYNVATALAARALAPTLVYTRNARTARLVATLGLEVALELHNPPNSAAQASALRWLAQSERCRRVVCITDRLRRIVIDSLGLSDRKLAVEHDAVDLERFSQRLDPSSARARLGVDTRSRAVVLHTGSLYEGRGGEQLVDLLPQLPHAECWFVGGRAKDVRRVSAHAERRGVVERCRFFGHRELHELPTFYRAADVLVVASTTGAVASDGKTMLSDWASPMKVFEYMAAERPIVSGAFAGVSEVLHHEQNALLFPPDDVSTLGASVARLLDDSALGARLSAQARSDVEAHTWRARTARLARTLGLEA
jgi:glycosyltransferase involved in cell wall biosynthesis